MVFCTYSNEGMSQTGSSEYPLPLTGPIRKSEFSSSGVETHLQNAIEYDNGVVNSSKSRRLPTSSSQDSLRIYSVKTHQRHKQPILASAVDKTECSINNINNNNNYHLEKEVKLRDDYCIGKDSCIMF